MKIPFYTYPAEKKSLLKRISNKELDFEKIHGQVFSILQEVKKKKEKAVFKYTKIHDKISIDSKNFKVSEKELKQTEKVISAKTKEAIRVAIKNIRNFHKLQHLSPITYKRKDGGVLAQKITAIEKAGLYVPGGIGGNTPLVSSLLMSAVPAQLAGVKHIVVTTPPNEKGSLNPNLLYALKQLHISNTYKCGGAQAIGALTYGTESIPKVDIIVGPGNNYVTCAKKIVFGEVMIDGVFGPSEIVVISDGSINPRCIACDLLSQAEHAGDELSVLISNNKKHLEDVQKCLKEELEKLDRKHIIKKSLANRGAFVWTKNLEMATPLINLIAPEHLEIMVKNPEKLSKKINHAAAIFIGKHSSEPIGDYIAGTNHVLPTNTSARFTSPLGTYTFQKRTNILSINQKAFTSFKPHAMQLAEIERLDAHKRALEVRDEC